MRRNRRIFTSRQNSDVTAELGTAYLVRGQPFILATGRRFRIVLAGFTLRLREIGRIRAGSVHTLIGRVACLEVRRYFTAVFSLRGNENDAVFDDRSPYEFDGSGRASSARRRPAVRHRRLTGTSLAGRRQLPMSLSKIRGVDRPSPTDRPTKCRLSVSVCLMA